MLAVLHFIPNNQVDAAVLLLHTFPLTTLLKCLSVRDGFWGFGSYMYF